MIITMMYIRFVIIYNLIRNFCEYFVKFGAKIDLLLLYVFL